MSSWYLTEIKSASGTDTITFSYTGAATMTARQNQDFKEIYYVPQGYPTSGCGGLSPNTVQSWEIFDSIWLSTITTDFGTVEFFTSDRTDVPTDPGDQPEQQLDFINVTASGNLVKQFAFGYDYFSSRLRLLSVQEIDPQNPGESLPPYQFTYNQSFNLPIRLSHATDHWGYYNGKVSNSGAIPGIFYEYDPNQYEYFEGDEADRFVDSSKVQLGVLTHIDYPTHGHTTFTYESNDYSQVGGALIQFGYGPVQTRNQEAPSEVGENPGAEFDVVTIAPEQIPMRLRFHYELEVDNGVCTGGHCIYFRLEKKVGGVFQEVFTYSVFPQTMGSPNTVYYTHLLDEGTYRLVPASVHPTAYIEVTAQWRDKIPVAEKLAGGLRIKRIESYDGIPGSSPIVRKYEYRLATDPSRSSGVIINEPRYHYLGGTPSCVFVGLSSRSRIALGTTQGSTVGYADVKVLYGQNGEGGYSHPHFQAPDFQPDEMLTDDEWPFGAMTSRDWKRGQLNQKEVVSSSDVVQARRENSYYFDDEAPVPDPRVTKNYRALTVKRGPLDVLGQSILYYRRYEIISSWVHPASETITIYDQNGANAVTTTRTTHYDDFDHIQLTKLEEVNNDGRVRNTEYKYAHEQHQTGMNANGKHMLAQVYSTTVKEGTNDVEGKAWTTWALDGTAYRPEEAWVWIGNGSTNDTSAPANPSGTCTSPGSEVLCLTRYESYDALGRVLEQKDTFGNSTLFTYNELGTRALGRVSQGTLSIEYKYYDANDHKWGLLKQVKDENGDANSYDYDSFRRLKGIYLDDVPPFTTPLTEFDYVFSSDLSVEPNYIRTTTHLEGSHAVETTEFIDGLGRSILSQLKEDASTFILSVIEYDALGRPFKTWKPYRNNSSTHDPSKAIQEHGSNPFTVTSYLPDPLNRVDRVEVEGGGVFVESDYKAGTLNGDMYTYLETTDEDGKRTHAYTDLFGNQVQSAAGVGTSVADTTEMIYDVLGNLKEVRPPNYFNPPGTSTAADWITTYQYDPRSLVVSKTTPDADGSSDYTYDAKGNLRFIVDPRRQSGGYLFTDYDQFARIVETGRCPSGSPPSDPHAGPTSCSQT